MEKQFTHIVECQASKKAEILFRASDGVRIAHRNDRTVIFGENPNKSEGRYFADSHYAHLYVEHLASEDLRTRGVEQSVLIDFRDIEDSGIILPENALEFPGSQPRGFKN